MLIGNIFPFPTIFLFNSLSNDKISELTKFKEVADDKKSLTQKLKFMLGKVENIMLEKEKMLVTMSHNIFKRLLFQGC